MEKININENNLFDPKLKYDPDQEEIKNILEIVERGYATERPDKFLKLMSLLLFKFLCFQNRIHHRQKLKKCLFDLGLESEDEEEEQDSHKNEYRLFDEATGE